MLKKYHALTLILCTLIFLTGTFVRSQNPVNDKQEVFKWKVVSVYPVNIPILIPTLQDYKHNAS